MPSLENNSTSVFRASPIMPFSFSRLKRSIQALQIATQTQSRNTPHNIYRKLSYRREAARQLLYRLHG